jgi:hypothetical protein
VLKYWLYSGGGILWGLSWLSCSAETAVAKDWFTSTSDRPTQISVELIKPDSQDKTLPQVIPTEYVISPGAETIPLPVVKTRQNVAAAVLAETTAADQQSHNLDPFSLPALPLSPPLAAANLGENPSEIGPPATAPQPSPVPLVAKPGPIFITQVTSSDEAEPTIDPELGIIRIRNQAGDPELGILRIREQPSVPVTAPAGQRPYGFLSTRIEFASSDNILLAVNDVGGLTGDEFFRPGVSLAFYPSVSPSTFLIGTVDYNLQRYTTQSEFNYDDLRLRLGLRQGLSQRTYGQLLFTYQQLFRPGSMRFRFFENTAFSLTLGRRDPLTDQLTLNSYYQIQLNEAVVRASVDSPVNATDFDRITQSLGGALSYSINSQFQTILSYQVTLADYTGQERYDTYHQLIGQLTYRITPDIRMSLYGGWSFGRSSEPRIQFDDTLFGITLDATIPLF